ncbi:YeeE/YedE family protein [Pseudoduganella chitinolytica]|uniref:YeeE/YedE family protein n=1 Tax=Pseudoduganella chitinolytica TaxID=34070 RepID=A0ABY8B9E1_9BURK|nr:YeeE/YedE family protein [Pseudoduganella chitinolytica]WEF32550.1 YeeE/YedE family protein [Pseudoduganella chitinolytica]
MTIDWLHFTPWTSLAGGLLIGAAAALLILLNGRIAGISGIVGGLLRAPRADRRWRLAFLAGLLLAAPLWRGVAPLPGVHPVAGGAAVLLAGLLVGFGTRLGAGCTSGHGVCGLARLSPRSLAATATFMLAGAVIVFVLRHLVGA